MKTRNDFVSNSSSCSFIVYDVKKSLELFKKLGDFPYQLDDFDIRIAYKHKYAKDIYKAFRVRDPEIENRNYYWDNHREIDPDEIEYFYDTNVYDLYELIEKNDTDIFNKIEYIDFSCHNDNQLNTGIICLLYNYFKKHGLKVNCEDTEIEFLNSDTFIINLVNGLISDNK